MANVNLKAVVRVRPLVRKEIDEGCHTCVETVGESQILVGSSSFTFSATFAPDAEQSYVYDATVGGLVDNLFKGHNVTVFAYGQTGSGKTFTMGTNDTLETMESPNCGIIPRALRDVFLGIQERSEKSKFDVKLTYVELYKEEFRDLLSSRCHDGIPIVIREGPNGTGPLLVNVSEKEVATYAQVITLMQEGNKNRAVGATAMNAESSRSHAILILTIAQYSIDIPDDVVMAKFRLVDLAGSESAKKTKAEGVRLQEGIKINRGLLALGCVIEQAAKNAALQVRDSKLTRVLQDSFGGNAHTVMIACVSPADSNMSETMSTLRYADRAQLIKNKPIVNRDPQQAKIAALMKENAEIKSRMTILEAQLGLNCTIGPHVCSCVCGKKIEAAAPVPSGLSRRTYVCSKDDAPDDTEDDDEEVSDDEKENIPDEESEEVKREIACLEEAIGLQEKELENHTFVAPEDMNRASANVVELEGEVAELKKGKERLETELNSKNNREKVGEDRRKKLRDLEDKLSKTVRELEKATRERELLKRKQQDYEKKVVECDAQVQKMKAAKVELMKKLREEGNLKRKEKMEMDKKLRGVKEENFRMVAAHKRAMAQIERENNALKIRLDQYRTNLNSMKEAEKRAADVLKHKNTLADQLSAGAKGKQVFKASINYIASEVDRHTLRIVTKNFLDDVITARQEAAEELKKVRSREENKEKLSEKEVEKINADIDQWKARIEVLSTQINAMNADCQNVDFSAPAQINQRKLDEMFRSLPDAKRVIQHMFQRLVQEQSKGNLCDQRQKALKVDLQNVREELAATQEDSRAQRKNYQKILFDIVKKYHNDATFSLDNTVAAADFVQELAISSEEENHQLRAQIADLEKQIQELTDAKEKAVRDFKVAARFNRRATVMRAPGTTPIETGASPLGNMKALEMTRLNATRRGPIMSPMRLPMPDSDESASEGDDEDESDYPKENDESRNRSGRKRSATAEVSATGTSVVAHQGDVPASAWDDDDDDDDEEDAALPVKKKKLADEIVLPTPKHTGVPPGRGRGVGVAVADSRVQDLFSPGTPIEADDPKKDPDWHFTPLQKRLSQAHSKDGDTPSSSNRRISDAAGSLTQEVVTGGEQPVSLSCDVLGKKEKGSCTCKGDCSKKICGCRKKGQSCSYTCACVGCVNNKAAKDVLPEESDEEQDQETREGNGEDVTMS